MHLQIRPGMLRVWRAPGRLQIGLDAAHAVVLDGLTAPDEQVLALLAEPLSLDELLRVCRQRRISVSRVRALVDLLTSAGVLVVTQTPPGRLHHFGAPATAQLRPDADALSVAYHEGDGWELVLQRADQRAAVVGLGRCGLAVASHLARAGLGMVVLDDDRPVARPDVAPGGYRPSHLGRRRADVAAELLAEACPQTSTSASGLLRPDLVVLVDHWAVDASRADGLLREDVPHLAVVLREQGVVVGPLVRPGQSACLRCLDLHRRDRDPQWPRLVPQLVSAGRGTRAREETALAALAAALAAAQALTHLDGRVLPASVDATLEASLPDALVAVRPWTSHQECGCVWPAGTPLDEATGRRAHLSPARTE
ncbi:MAG: ThiF family adenylyltransferase [Actinomycetes bacterium]